MTRETRWPGSLPKMAPFLLLAGGCLGGPAHLPHLAEGDPVVAGLPQACKNHVYVFMLQGLDPLQSSSQSAMREYLVGQGYIKTYLAPAFYAPWYIHEIRRLHKDDPEARFVLVGFGYGAELGRGVARKIEKDGATVDLLVRIDRDSAKVATERFENIGLVVNLESEGLWDATPDSQHPSMSGVAAAGHPATLETLALQLAHVACNVPVRETALAEVPQGPTPRVRKPARMNEEEAAEWSFLRPDSLSRSSPIAGSPVLSSSGQATPVPTSPVEPHPMPTPPATSKPAVPAQPPTINVTVW